ncbi:MAG: extracellular solute-binding protein [Ktedonobacteraceae bacterium]|nr:extracellular solute-binding protein [Ktedonobacteraceae bacterium]
MFNKLLKILCNNREWGSRLCTDWQILDGKIKPDIWSPAGSVWISLLNAQWSAQHNGANLIGTGAHDVPSLVNSPVVIAMWRPLAEALGWPGKAIGWSDIAKLSTDPHGWSAYGHPELDSQFGSFKFGHTHPGYSNSGLDSVIAMNYAAVNKRSGLTSADVKSAMAKQFVNNVESSVIHYGDSTGFFAEKMFGKGPAFLSACVMYESLVVEANNGKKYPHLPYPVVAIYPKEGTFFSDHPFAVLQADWVTPAKKAAAQVLRQFLLAPAQQKKALQYGFRPSDPRMQLTAPLDKAHGVDPAQPQSVLPIPNAGVVSDIGNIWQEQRRKVDVMLVLDRSGSMNDSIGDKKKIDDAKEGLQQFVSLMSDNDQLGLTVFSTGSDVISPLSPLGPKRQEVKNSINALYAEGWTYLYDTVGAQHDPLQAFPSRDIKALVVLSDGQDTSSTKYNLNSLIEKVKAKGRNAGESIKIFTIAYGNDADVNVLKQIAEATGGQEYAGTPQDIQEIYFDISEFLAGRF